MGIPGYYRSFSLFGFNWFSCFYQNRFGWFRLFGIGLVWKDKSIHGLTFSQRNGYTRGISIGKWYISNIKK